MKKLLAALLSGGMLAAGSLAWADPLLINGAGATFPYPIYSKWFDVYHQSNPDVQFNYQSIGSGGGIRQITAKTVDFGATDGPMSDAQIQTAEGWTILHFPTVMGGVVPIYNVDGVTGKLNFTQKAISGIFLGTITKWNDAEIQGSNPDAKLPASDIIVVHRSDGSGTSFCWTDFLSKISPEWKSKVGKGTAVNWPVGLGGKGNEGVAGLVKQTPNSIGYVELIYATQNKIDYGALQNAAGKFITCSLDSVSAAAAAVKMPADFRVSITNAPGDNVYPASTFTWLLVYKVPPDKAKGKALVDFMKWMLTEGQKYTQDLGYAPLPANVIEMEKAAINKIKV
jgi:phosphate transport system substrate-binding protein